MEHVKCDLCGEDDYTVVHESVKQEEIPGAEVPAGETAGESAGEPSAGGFSEKYRAASTELATEQVVRCHRCGLVYINPRLPAGSIVGGYEQAVDEAYVSQGEARMATFAHGLKMVEEYVPGRGRILDVGAAAGFFLKVAKDAGWEAYGVEPSKWLADYSRREFGLDIKAGTLRDAAFPDGYFDAVTMWDVLEHTPSPAAELDEVYRILKPGGILVVNFPDFGSVWARVFGRRWWWLLSVHLYYFTPDTLKRMLAQHGFETLKVRPHFQRLKLGYLVYRFKVYSGLVYKVGDVLVRTLRMSNVQIPYNASQTNLIARKAEQPGDSGGSGDGIAGDVAPGGEGVGE